MIKYHIFVVIRQKAEFSTGCGNYNYNCVVASSADWAASCMHKRLVSQIVVAAVVVPCLTSN